MRDKEVGKVWQNAIRIMIPSETMQDVIALICKLVADRIIYYSVRYDGQGISTKAARKRALKDFGINPATWKVEHE
jgi:hypothetical protein